MKKYSKLMSLILAGGLMCSLAACGSTGQTNGVENSNSIVAEIDGTTYTRGEVGDSLLTAEADAITTHLLSVLQNDFFKDVTVTDDEVNLQLETMKAQVGEENWPMYLAYYGGGSEDSFREQLKVSLRQEKYIQGISNTITLEESEIEEAYNENPDSYNIAVLDVIFFGDADALSKGVDLVNQGYTLDEIATELEMEISEDEHTYYSTDNLTWNKELSTCSVGDMIYTAEDSGSYVVGEIVELNSGLDNAKVHDDLENSLKYSKAYEQVNTEYEDFVKSKTVKIMGEEYSIVDGDFVKNLTAENNATVSTDTSTTNENTGTTTDTNDSNSSLTEAESPTTN